MDSKYTGCCIALLCRTVYHPPTAPSGPRCWLDCAYLAEHCCRMCSCVSSCTKALAWYLHCEETTVETLSWRQHWSGQSRWMPDRAAAAVCLMEQSAATELLLVKHERRCWNTRGLDVTRGQQHVTVFCTRELYNFGGMARYILSSG